MVASTDLALDMATVVGQPIIVGFTDEPFLQPADALQADAEVGEPWGQYGLDSAFGRIRNRAGFAGWSVYALRHYAITTWLRRGIPVHVVQKMAGHRNLSTTQHYVQHPRGRPRRCCTTAGRRARGEVTAG